MIRESEQYGRHHQLVASIGNCVTRVYLLSAIQLGHPANHSVHLNNSLTATVFICGGLEHADLAKFPTSSAPTVSTFVTALAADNSRPSPMEAVVGGSETDETVSAELRPSNLRFLIFSS